MQEQKQSVLTLGDVNYENVKKFLQDRGLALIQVQGGEEIPGSFWGQPEAGLKGQSLFARHDTPLHSILHETCHFICMDEGRRRALDTNAGGDYDEENAVCYLQIILADQIEGFGHERCMADMDRWGYSFRLGSAKAWFESDAEDALAWLEQRNLLRPRQQAGK